MNVQLFSPSLAKMLRRLMSLQNSLKKSPNKEISTRNTVLVLKKIIENFSMNIETQKKSLKNVGKLFMMLNRNVKIYANI